MEFLDSVPSTMDAARDNLRAGRVRFDAGGNAFPPGVVARDQTAGRGQRGRTWFARPGECLCATYYFACGLQTDEWAAHIPFVAGVAVAETLRGVCKAVSTANIGLKWPNDILLNGKKIGGILIEMVQTASVQMQAAQPELMQRAETRPAPFAALIGVGVNIAVTDFPPDLAPFATSLRLEGVPITEDLNWMALANAVGASLAHQGQRWREAGIGAILDDWRQYDQTPGRVFETSENGLALRGVAGGVADDGALRLRLEDGNIMYARSASSLKEIPD